MIRSRAADTLEKFNNVVMFEMIMIEQIGLEMDGAVLCRALGVVGFLSYMAGYTALQFRMIDGDGLTYSISKVLGATLVLISLTTDFNLSAALIQVSFLGIGMVGIFLRIRDRRRPSGRDPRHPHLPERAGDCDQRISPVVQ